MNWTIKNKIFIEVNGHVVIRNKIVLWKQLLQATKICEHVVKINFGMFS